MFGFLNPRPHSGEYRRAYARLCQHQRRAYGLLSLPFHSYEAVFLYQCALDAGALPGHVLPAVRCCRLVAPTTLSHDPDAAVGRFCASVALLLGSVKLEDDIRDARNVRADHSETGSPDIAGRARGRVQPESNGEIRADGNRSGDVLIDAIETDGLISDAAGNEWRIPGKGPVVAVAAGIDGVAFEGVTRDERWGADGQGE